MRNPFDGSVSMTRQELLNYIFKGQQEKYSNLDYNDSDFRPHILKQYMEDMVDSAKDAYRRTNNLHSLLKCVSEEFFDLYFFLLDYHVIYFSKLDEVKRTFLVKLLKNELSLRQIIRTFYKNNNIIRALLKNKGMTRAILRRINSSEWFEKFFNTEMSDELRVKFFINCFDTTKSEKEKLDKNSPFYNDLEKVQGTVSFVNFFNTDNDDKEKQFFDNMRKLLMFEYFPIKYVIKQDIPVELHEISEQFCKLMFVLISGDFKYSHPLGCMTRDDIEYKKLKPLPENQIIFRKKCILFNDINFNTKDSIEIVTRLLQQPFKGFRYVGFKHCSFKLPLVLEKATKTKLFFENCDFHSLFHLQAGTPKYITYFEKCNIFGDFIFGKSKVTPYLPCGIEFKCCVFMPNSSLEVSNISDEYSHLHVGYIQMTDTTFNGNLRLENLSKKANVELSLKDMSFTTPFAIENCYFGKKSKLENISFVKPHKQVMKDSIKYLVQSLQASGLNNLAIDNGLLEYEADKSTANETDKDMQSYKIACESGFLKPKYAAYHLGMSKDNLAKKRMADKQRITRESIPYVGKGKSILYPVDALDAFKIQDWELLKELREKYAQNDSFEDDE